MELAPGDHDVFGAGIHEKMRRLEGFRVMDLVSSAFFPTKYWLLVRVCFALWNVTLAIVIACTEADKHLLLQWSYFVAVLIALWNVLALAMTYTHRSTYCQSRDYTYSHLITNPVAVAQIRGRCAMFVGLMLMGAVSGFALLTLSWLPWTTRGTLFHSGLAVAHVLYIAPGAFGCMLWCGVVWCGVAWRGVAELLHVTLPYSNHGGGAVLRASAVQVAHHGRGGLSRHRPSHWHGVAVSGHSLTICVGLPCCWYVCAALHMLTYANL
jgi:hypothetical protein